MYLSGTDEVVKSIFSGEKEIMVTDLVYHDLFVKHEMSTGHPENPNRVISALKYIENAGFFNNEQMNLLTPIAPDINEIYEIHDKSYIEGINEKSRKGGGFYTLDTQVNTYTYDAALLAAGGGIQTVDRIMIKKAQNAFLLCRPPGHHAEYTRAFGFCFINNIAVAAKHLLTKYGLSRIMIIDYDAHHGNGTQNAFYSSNQVLYLGFHQDGRTLFPGSGFPDEMGKDKGYGYTVNLAMYPGAGDVSYEMAFSEVVEPIAETFNPEFILVSVGFDGHYKDPLTSLGLTSSGFSLMNERIKQISAKYASNRLACFLEGGYNLDIMGMGTLNLVEELLGEKITHFDDQHKESDICKEYTKELIHRLIDASPLL